MTIGLMILVLVIVVPVAYLVWRFRQGDEPVAGGSQGRQLFGRKDDDWGPKGTKQP